MKISKFKCNRKTPKIHLILTSLRQKTEKVICDDKVPALTCWTAQFFWKRTKVPNYHTLCALTFTALQSSPLAGWYVCEKSPIPKHNGVPRSPFLPFNCRNKESGAHRPYLLFPAEIHLGGPDMAEQHLFSVLVHRVTQRWHSKLLNCGLHTDGFWVQAMKVGRKEKVQDFHSHQVT